MPTLMTATDPLDDPPSPANRWKWIVGGVLLVLFIGLVRSSLGGAAMAFGEWLRGAGWPGIALFALAYVLGTSVFVPASLFSAIAGFAWGPVVAFCVVWPSATVSALLSFLAGRYVARSTVQRWIARSRLFSAIDRAVQRNGFRVVALLRLSPVVPYTAVNYVLGVTSVRPLSFVAGTAVGMLPNTLAFAFVGSAFTRSLVPGAEGGADLRLIWLVGGLTVLAIVLLAQLARRELAKEFAPDAPATAEPAAAELAPMEPAAVEPAAAEPTRHDPSRSE